MAVTVLGQVAASGEELFSYLRIFPVGNQPAAVAIADLNGDAALDVVTANYRDVSVLLGNGDGGLQVAASYPTQASQSRSVAVADLDGDGLLDVVAAGSSSASVLLGNGDGSLRAANSVSYPSIFGIRGVAVADLDADHVADIVVFEARGYNVLFGNGDGSFRVFSSGLFGDPWIGAIDVNGDRIVDIVTTHTIRLGTSEGGLGPPIYIYPAEDGHRWTSVAGADLNGDGALDLVTVDADRGDLSVLLGNGDGRFQSAVYVGTQSAPTAVVIGDLNGDGIPDLATSGPDSSDVSALLGVGDGSFQLDASFAVGEPPASIAIGNLDGVGPPEIIAASASSSVVTIFQILSAPPAPPRIDVMPGGEANWIDPGRTGVLPVVIFGSEYFEVADIDASTIGFGPAGARPAHDLSKRGVFEGHLGDVDGDGFTDLITHFRNLDTGIRLRDTEACLSCRTFGGVPFEACDPIRARRDALVGSLFRTPRQYPAGENPHAIAVGDFNGDGVVDVVTALTSEVSVLLGNGDGSFGAPIASSVGVNNYPWTIAVADFDGDAVLDLAAFYGSRVGVLRGNGDGTFVAPVVYYGISTYGAYVAVGDLNGDQAFDIVAPIVGASGRSTVHVLFGNGDGSFQPVSTFQFVDDLDESITSLAMADFDGDGILDLAATTVDRDGKGSVRVRLNNGDGTFGQPFSLEAGNFPYGIVAGDFNADGAADVATAKYSYSYDAFDSISVWLGNGDGSLQAGISSAAEIRLSRLEAADFDNDGVLDVYSLNDTLDVSVLLGNGDGRFRAALSFEAGSGSFAAAAADLDHDGRLDLVTADYYSSGISVLLGQGDGSFDAAASMLVGHALPYGRYGTYSGSQVAVADLDGDGILDVVNLLLSGRGPGTSYSRTEVGVLLGSGSGGLRLVNSYFPELSTRALAIADLDGDAIPDLATASNSGLSVLFGNGDGSFRPAVLVAAAASLRAVAAADFNRDGHADLVSVRVSAQRSDVLVALSNGDGSFRPPLLSPTGIEDLYSDSIGVADINRDGIPDLVTASAFGDRVNAMLGDGAGGFQAPIASPAGVGYLYPGPTSITVTRIDRDKNLDLVVLSGPYGDGVKVLLGKGDGSFRDPIALRTGAVPASIAVADFDGDHNPDLVAANEWSGDVSVRLGNGDGSFQAAASFAAGDGPASVATGDFDGDGATDFIVGNYDTGTLTIFLNQCDRTVCSAGSTSTKTPRMQATPHQGAAPERKAREAP